MTTEPALRRRRRGSAAPESTTTEVTTETASASAAGASTDTSPPSLAAAIKTVPELLAEESRAFANFIALVLIVVAFFAYMVQVTELPPPGRVFGIMIDAGSTGTRAQVFVFRQEVGRSALVLDETKMFRMPKSIAALATGTAEGAFFKPLLEKVKKAVPGVRRRKRTPIALRATAGLRLLGEEEAEYALEQARAALNASEFLFREEWVSLLEDKEEAAHAWTTVNFLKGNFHGKDGEEEVEHVGALDLGGASMQIVFKQDEVDKVLEDEEEEQDNSKVEGDDEVPEDEEEYLREEVPSFEEEDHTVEVFGNEYSLHSTSHLGLGLFDFTKKLYLLFDREGVLEEGNPCFRKGKVFEQKTLRFGVPGSEESRVVTMTGDGHFDRCVASAEITIAEFSKLYTKKSRLPKGKPFYAFAYFYDRTVGLGVSATPSKDELVAKGKELCQTPPDEDVDGDFDEACAEFSYIYTLLKIFTDDFSSPDVHIRFEQFVDGHMLGWALGAMLDTVQPVMHMQLSLDSEPLIGG